MHCNTYIIKFIHKKVKFELSSVSIIATKYLTEQDCLILAMYTLKNSVIN